MQKLIYFIRKTGVAIVFVILEIVAIRCYAYSTPYTQARLLVWSNAVVGYVYSAFAGVSNYFTLRKENIRLTEHIATLENRIRLLEASVPENKMMVEGALRQYDYLSAKVISSSTNRSRNFITLNKGYTDGVSVDMGGGFDLMDERSHHNAPGLTPEQEANRRRLCAIMAYAGFAPYECEWWHYRLMKEPYPDTYFDFDIEEESHA